MPYGLTFLFPAADEAVGASLRISGEFARAELDLLVGLAQGSGTMIDVGANIGAIALPFAARLPAWRVIAIEAHRALSGVLHANSLNNRLYNVEVIHAAAGSKRAVVEFTSVPLSEKRNFGALGFTTASQSKESVRMLTLDELAPADTRLVKVDVEGYEPEVLKGAGALIRRRTAIWLVEAGTQYPEATSQVIKIFKEAGYSVYWFYAPFATPASPKARPADIGRGDPNVIALPPGVRNIWDLPLVRSEKETCPLSQTAYPYLKRYGY